MNHQRYRKAAERMAEEALWESIAGEEKKTKQQAPIPEGVAASGSGTTPQSREEVDREQIPVDKRSAEEYWNAVARNVRQR